MHKITKLTVRIKKLKACQMDSKGLVVRKDFEEGMWSG